MLANETTPASDRLVRFTDCQEAADANGATTCFAKDAVKDAVYASLSSALRLHPESGNDPRTAMSSHLTAIPNTLDLAGGFLVRGMQRQLPHE
jgi:hypothetical protein